jgi:(1->4)-alpha-D-glucan 1-alpha-D-glucosylmutase
MRRDMDRNNLEKLASIWGVETGYHDIWGNWRTVPDETLESILTSMGLSMEESSVPRFWGLEPVYVLREKERPFKIAIRIPEEESKKEFEWIIWDESGGEKRGTFRPCDHGYFLPIDSILTGLGYYQLQVIELAHLADGGAVPKYESTIIITPETCYMPPELSGDEKVFGLGAQLYALRSSRNWGMGDFTDLKELLKLSSGKGAGILGINPISALFPQNPEHASPYSPSSRIFLNYFYLDLEAVQDFQEANWIKEKVDSPEFQARLSSLRKIDQVDYSGVAEVKQEILEALWGHFKEHHILTDSERARQFRNFQQRGDNVLFYYGVFEAISEYFHKKGQAHTYWGWPVWPEEYRDPMSPKVLEFAKNHMDRVEFFHYVQWQADMQLASLGRLPMEQGLKVGLYMDLPVSVDGAGFDTWFQQDVFALGARVGAPPDDFNLKGQDWGLSPFIPHKLKEKAYLPFILMLRANMKYAGALRIDHVMGLMRLFWVPPGEDPERGAYVRYPFKDLLGILALESKRNRCLVIGEDLGTVPDEVREALGPMNVLSYRVSYFEKNQEGNLKLPQDYPKQALCAVSTHDLPTLWGYWIKMDIATRTDLDLFPSEELRARQIMERAKDKARFLIRLMEEGLLPEGMDVDPDVVPEMTSVLSLAIHKYLARTPSKIFMIQLEDILGQVDQVNLPGTTTQYPNWRKKLPILLESLEENKGFVAILDSAREIREVGFIRRILARRTEGNHIIPREILSTYRVQLHKDFPFRRLAELIDYLKELGISHCYLSPFLMARPGSHHGYDITDHSRITPEIGTEEGLENLCNTLQQHEMGIILDFVPNHMGVGSDNRWWMDVMENGRASQYADYFDINWRPFKEELNNKVLLPILSDYYGNVLERGEIQLESDLSKGIFQVCYYEHRYPIDPKTYSVILSYDLERLKSRVGIDVSSEVFNDYCNLIDAFKALPSSTDIHSDRIFKRKRDAEVLKRRLSKVISENREIQAFIQENLVILNGIPEKPGSFDLLHQLLDQQNYRFAFWRVAMDEINYRRFFDINDLACLRVENPLVFEDIHRFVLELIERGIIDGLRIDHPDGLYDPVGYFKKLQDEIPKRRKGLKKGATYYIVAEKILSHKERLPDDWAVRGTTGYEFSALANGLFVERSSRDKMTRIYSDFLGKELDCDAILCKSKRLIMKVALSSELNVLAILLDRISESSRYTRDFTFQRLRDALIEVVVHFPVYRTYISPGQVSAKDRLYVIQAVEKAKSRSRLEDRGPYEFIKEILLMESTAYSGDDLVYRSRLEDLAMKFQQYTAPIMAKGLEDTFFYIYNRLLPLNEVGSDPRIFGIEPDEFHQANLERLKKWPDSMLNTSTHDSKRSEDVRARINVLSEIPEKWNAFLARLTSLAFKFRQKSGEKFVPDRNDEYALYQTLLGSWPMEELDDKGLSEYRSRIEAYMIKAMREAKENTSWINPDTEYEEGVTTFIRLLLSTEGDNPFLREFIPFQKTVSRLGCFNSLSCLLLKLTSPGVPNIYQGNESWRFCLVDPDNRRPVDFDKRKTGIEELKNQIPGEGNLKVFCRKVFCRTLAENLEDGKIKQFATWKSLQLRRRFPELFKKGEYIPMYARGELSRNLCAFARRWEENAVITAAPRLIASLCNFDRIKYPLGKDVWKDTRLEFDTSLAGKRFQNIFTGEVIEVERNVALSEIFSVFPIALFLVFNEK